jgi:hypothetical protein
MGHNGVTDSPYCDGKEKTHDLHLNSKGKRRLTTITAEVVVMCQV